MLRLLLLFLLLFPFSVYASFIEATQGTAVINDVTATYHNPSALTLIKNPQFIALGTVAYFNSSFAGQAVPNFPGATLSGTTSNNTHYYLPALYFGTPVTKNIDFGIALISNYFNRDSDSGSILRYIQSSNSVQNYDLTPAIGIKLNDYISVGGGITYSYANFVLQPTTGIPGLDIPDGTSRNVNSGRTWGGNVGILIKPTPVTLIGLDYHSIMSYQLTGHSYFEGVPPITSNHYGFNFFVPARSVLSVSHFFTPKLGLIGTVQRIQWSIFTNVHAYGIATQVGGVSQIIPAATIPFYFHNRWVFTLGTQYRATPKLIMRLAATYVQSPSTGYYQVSNGDSTVLGVSAGYDVTKNVTIDGSYAHDFMQNQNINITGPYNITGVSKGNRDAVSLKLTLNL